MEFTIGLAQCAHPQDHDVAALVERWARRAKGHNVDLLVFPECLMTPFGLPAEEFAAAAEPLGGAFTQAVDAIARESGLWMVYTVNERNPADLPPFNTAVVVDDAGRRRGVYRKVHLFDAGSYRESDKMSAGTERPEPVRTPFCTLGLGICYDLRFPGLARLQAAAGCELIVYPAAWVDGPGKRRQWETLLAARAVENGVYVAGVCRSGSRCVGTSAVFDPTGNMIAQSDPGEQLLCCTMDTDVVAQAQRAMPILEHRRVDLYGPCD